MKGNLFTFATLFTAIMFSVNVYSQDVDKTSLVSTEASAWNGTWCATQYAPEVTTTDGRTAQMVEHFQSGGCDKTGIILAQTVTGLENGVYSVVVYANAMSTHERDGFESDASNYDTSIAYVFAGNKKTRLNAKIATSINTNDEYTIENVVVTNGYLTLGLGKNKPGTNWHTIQIKSLVWHTNRPAFYIWKNGEYLTHYICTVDSITFTKPDNSNQYKPETPEYAVDLGLPSGTLWADRNIGANSPEDYGYYFAWGETKPKDYYDWSNYKWCNGSSDSMTKYCTISGYGYNDFTDDKTILEPADDAAIANWGNEWCMPTDDQLSELIIICNWNWVTQNSIKGYKVTGPNGNSIFLPAAGHMHSGGISHEQEWCFYWSKTLKEEEPCYAFTLGFDSIGYDINYNSDRDRGRVVRAVVANK